MSYQKFISPIYSLGSSTSYKPTRRGRVSSNQKATVLRRYVKKHHLYKGSNCPSLITIATIAVSHFKIPYLGIMDKKDAKRIIESAYAKIPSDFFKQEVKNKKFKKNKTNYQKKIGFYDTDAWRSLRYEALKIYGRRCMVCGAVPETGAQLHVDHIKPRSLFPELELSLANLQILCRDCNLGKSNKDSIDWRTSS